MTLWKKMRPPLVTALVATAGEDASVNASPKSWWSPVSYSPAVLMLSVKPESDTERNIRSTGLFVLHLPPQSIAKEVLHTAKPLPYGENELEDQKLPWEWLVHPMLPVDMPYMPSIPWMCCRITNVLEAQPERSDHTIYLAHVLLAGGFEEDGVVDVLMHRGRNQFCDLGKPFEVEPY